MAEWFTSAGGIQNGPYSTDQLREMRAAGAFPPDTHAWRDGMPEWQPLASIDLGPPMPPRGPAAFAPAPFAPPPDMPPPNPSLFPCRGCGRLIHFSAPACPHCGAVNDHNPNYSPTDKRILIAFVLCFFLGGLGMHRFYVGKWGTAILMIVTLAGLGIWWLVDMIIIATGNFTDSEGNKITVWL